MDESFRFDLREIASRLHGDWPEIGVLAERESNRVVIAGRPGSGKRALVNSMWGWPAFDEATAQESIQHLGLFTLVTPPTDESAFSDLLFQLENADLIVYLLDAESSPTEDDIRWIARLRALPPALLIVLTEVDPMEDTPSANRAADLRERFARPVLALNARDMQMVHEQFLPAALRLCPQLTVPLAAEITSLRWKIVRQLIRESALKSGLSSLENSTIVDLPVLLDLQRRLAREIARAYGYGEQGESLWTQGVSAAQHLLLHYAGQSLGNLAPFWQKVALALISMTSTWAFGQQATARFSESGRIKRPWPRFSRNGHQP